MEAEGVFDFTATEDDELSFNRGARLHVIDMEDDPNWFEAEHNGSTGLVPNNYIRFLPNDWYIKNCNREDAEDRLLRRAQNGSFIHPDGAFIVRRSGQTVPNGPFSLSVKYMDRVIHFRILNNSQHKYYLWESQVFDSINQLIDYHRRNSVSRNENICLTDRATGREPVGNAMNKHPNGAMPANSGGGGGMMPAAQAVPQPHQQQQGIPPRRVQARFDFEAQEDDELSFRRNDIITVLGYQDDNWWMGELNRRRGLFPSNYVMEYQG